MGSRGHLQAHAAMHVPRSGARWRDAAAALWTSRAASYWRSGQSGRVAVRARSRMGGVRRHDWHRERTRDGGLQAVIHRGISVSDSASLQSMNRLAALLRGETVSWRSVGMPATEWLRACVLHDAAGLVYNRLDRFPLDNDWPGE